MTSAQDTYLTVKEQYQETIKIKGSKFIATLLPASDKKAAEERIGRISRQYHDATHNCFAYRLGYGHQTIDCAQDDGEPSGTAGKPILSAIEKSGLTDVLVVVTRYFGGTKLGTGGLTRAYRDSARAVINTADVVTMIHQAFFEVTFPYEYTSQVMSLVSKHGVKPTDTQYGKNVQLQGRIRQSALQPFRNDIRDVTAARAELRIVERL